MSALGFDTATIDVLWRRDLKRFFRQPSRLVGALGQPIIFWGVIGSGMAATFKMRGSTVGYLEFFFPGVILMVVLFAAIFATVSVIEDRHQGFLQAVLAGPGSRTALVLGKSLGGATVALSQVALFILLAPFAGFSFGAIHWGLLLVTLLLTSVGLAAFGFAIAWWLDNIQGYHAIQMTLLIPLWVISGAMFPASDDHPLFAAIMRFNPLAYAVSATRRALYAGAAPGALPTSTALDLGVVAGFAVVSVALAVFACERRR